MTGNIKQKLEAEYDYTETLIDGKIKNIVDKIESATMNKIISIYYKDNRADDFTDEEVEKYFDEELQKYLNNEKLELSYVEGFHGIISKTWKKIRKKGTKLGKKLKKTVKKVAPIVVTAAAMYYGGPMISAAAMKYGKVVIDTAKVLLDKKGGSEKEKRIEVSEDQIPYGVSTRDFLIIMNGGIPEKKDFNYAAGVVIQYKMIVEDGMPPMTAYVEYIRNKDKYLMEYINSEILTQKAESIASEELSKNNFDYSNPDIKELTDLAIKQSQNDVGLSVEKTQTDNILMYGVLLAGIYYLYEK